MFRLSKLFCFSVLLIFFACSQKKNIEESTSSAEDALKERADSLAHAFIITDGHIDLPYRLKEINFKPEKKFLDLPVHSEDGDFDYERAKKGGLDAPFMSIYIPAELQISGGAKELADSLIDMVNSIIEAHPDKFGKGTDPATIEKNFQQGLISLPMGMENGAPIEDDLANVEYFYNRGIRYITLTHSKDNQICDSSYDKTGTWNGLSPFGRQVVAAMNSAGIMIDISHVSDSTFYQVMEITKAPVIASHSSLRHFTPGFQRNMSDDMLRRLAQNNGVIQINFGSSFLDSTARKYRSQQQELEKILSEQGLNSRDPEADSIINAFPQKYTDMYADVEAVADHIDRVVNLVGVDYVGIGSDFDGVGDSLPIGLKDVTQFPNLIHALLKRGYSDEDIQKICYKNVWRVWNEVIKVAQNS